jgi:hypothetical protein
MPLKKASIASPSGRSSSAMKKAPPPRKLSSITGALGAPIANGIVAPIVLGAFLSRCKKTHKRFNHHHIRMLWHGFVNADDIMFEWVDKCTLKVVIYDPLWWSDPEYQAAFDPDHGKDSNLIESMIDFQEDRKEKVPDKDYKRTANTGYFVFGEAMSIEDEDDTVVIPEPMKHNTIEGIYIVIKVRVAPDDKAEDERTPRKAKAGGTVAVAVGTGKNFVNVRQRDDDAMDVTGGGNEEEKQNRPPAKRSTYKSPRSSTQQLLLGAPASHPPAFPQSNLQLQNSAASASKSVISDGWSVDEIEIEKIPQEVSTEEEIIDDNRDLPDGF